MYILNEEKRNSPATPGKEINMKEVIQKIEDRIKEIENKNLSRHSDWVKETIPKRHPYDGGRINAYEDAKEIVIESSEKQAEIPKKAREKLTQNAVDRYSKSGALAVIEKMKNETSYSIAKKLNDMAIPTGRGKTWNPNQVDRVRKEYLPKIDPAELPPPPSPPPEEEVEKLKIKKMIVAKCQDILKKSQDANLEILKEMLNTLERI